MVATMTDGDKKFGDNWISTYTFRIDSFVQKNSKQQSNSSAQNRNTEPLTTLIEHTRGVLQLGTQFMKPSSAPHFIPTKKPCSYN